MRMALRLPPTIGALVRACICANMQLDTQPDERTSHIRWLTKAGLNRMHPLARPPYDARGTPAATSQLQPHFVYAASAHRNKNEIGKR